MSAIFISHSSADNPVAGELSAVLARAGHRSVFLDFDPQAGIPAGRHWERELYAQLRSCQAMVVLCSANSVASPWCFAEITHARALGKAIISVRLDTTPVWGLLTDRQVIDLLTDRAAGWQRLLHGLKAAGLDPTALADWDGARPPYPGLAAFEAKDAAVYFGRATAIQNGLETLARLRDRGGPRLVLVLGASGSGKSSLVRAGIVPRVERDKGLWLVAPPFRPLAKPLEGMAMALAALPGAPGWSAIRSSLDIATDPDRWLGVINDLRAQVGPEASVMLVVDQLEEALDASAEQTQGAERAAFLGLLRSVAEQSNGPLFVLATLRSDFLGAFQTHPLLRGVAYEPIHLAQIALADIGQVIEGPARMAGIELEPGLAQAMVADTATDNALPLLAFTLRELHDRFTTELQRGGRLTIDQYRHQLGGLQGAVARAAEALCEGSSAQELGTLRRALLGLVRIDTEGRFVRRVRLWRELPEAAHAQLERFVTARLLTSRTPAGGEHAPSASDEAMPEARSERVLEVAHETLFSSWQRLAGWLAADREFMLWRERLNSACATWQTNQRDATLVLRGPLLAEAQRWRSERASGEPAGLRTDALRPPDERAADQHTDLSTDALAFIDASVAQQQAEQAARDRGRRSVIAALLGAVAVFGVLAAAAGWQWRVANNERSVAVARQLATQAAEAFKRDPVRGLLLAVHSLQSAWTPDAHAALLERLDSVARARPPSAWKPHPGPIRAMALSPDGRWLATAGPGHVQLQSADGAVRDLGSRNGENFMHALAFSPDGKALASACEPTVVCVHDLVGSGEPLRLPRAQGQVAGLAFGAGGSLLAVHYRGAKGVRLFAWPGGTEQAPIESREFVPEGLAMGRDERWRQAVDGIAMSRDGRWLALSRAIGIEVWDVPSRRPLGSVLGSWRGNIAFNADGHYLVVTYGSVPVPIELVPQGDGTLAMAPLSRPDAPGSPVPFAVPAFSADSSYVAVSNAQDGAHIAGRLAEPGVSLAPHPAGSLVFATGRRLLTGGIDGTITEWDPDDKPLARIAHTGREHAVATSADGSLLATASDGDALRLIDAATNKELRNMRLAVDPGSLAFSADGRWLSAVQGNKLWLVKTATLRPVGPFVHDAKITAVRFEDGGVRVATSAQWDATLRYEVRRPTKVRVWDIASVKELGWRFDIEGDTKRTLTISAKASLDAIKPIEGGDAALAQRALTWPLAYTTDDLNFYPLTIEPAQTWLATKTTAGTPLVDLARERAKHADSVDQNPDGSAHQHAISADGRWLASAAGMEARLWPLRAEDLAAEACVRVPRNLSCAEWRDARGDAPYVKACPLRPDPPDLADCKAGAKP